MTRAEMEDFRPRLMSLLARLESDRAQLEEEARQPTGGEASGSLSDLPHHMADLGSHAFEADLTLGLLRNTELSVEEIRLALDRIDLGTYGTCETCHRPLPRARLQALPHARHCLPCEEKIESRSLEDGEGD
jgi:DnaK suppressor protein